MLDGLEARFILGFDMKNSTIKRTLLLLPFVSLLISGCGTSTPFVPFHTIAGSTGGFDNPDNKYKIIKDYKIGSQQIRVVREKDNSCKSGYMDHIELNGSINKDSSFIIEKVLKGINKCVRDDTKYTTAVYMNSDGGRVLDGLKIGEVFRKHGVSAEVAYNQVCASSCAFAFLGAKFRSIRNSGKLLFHAPYINNDFGGIKCTSKSENQKLKKYYTKMIGQADGNRLFDRTMTYCNKSGGWTINPDAAEIFGITSSL